MGCVCGKPSAIKDIRESPRGERPAGATALVAPAVPAKLSSSIERLAAVPRREEIGRARREAEKGGGGLREEDGQGEAAAEARRRRERAAAARMYRPRLSGSVPRAAEGEQVAAGWPAWLATVAGEAIRGWVPRRADSFEKLDKIGQGTYSNVYRARDLDNGKIVALKKVRFDNLEPESVRFMAREIHVLRRLDHPNIIKLEGLVTSRMSCSLYLVFEYMEHDLAGLASRPGLKFTEPQVKCYMQQLLQGLDHCHGRNILHRDIKGSNLLIDNNGILKIADFGLASFFDPDQNHPLTSRVVTLWYRPPELLLGATNYGVAVDLWSSGCILAELYAGNPIMPGRTEGKNYNRVYSVDLLKRMIEAFYLSVEQLHKIFKQCGSPSEDYWKKSKLPHATIFKPQQPYRRCLTETFKDFPSPALALINVLLSIDPADRGTAASALKCEFFTTKPFACDPSSLPRYPPSKELDAKVRDEEARRLRAAGKAQRLDLERRGPRESRAVPAPDANAELPVSLQKRHAQSNPRSRSEKFNPQHEEIASGFPIEPPRHAAGLQANEDSQGPSRTSHSGPLAQRGQWSKARRSEDEAPRASLLINSSSLSGSATFRRTLLPADSNGRIAQADGAVPSGRLSESCNEMSELTRKYDQLYRTRGLAGSHRGEEEENNNKGQNSQEYGSKDSKIHYSGPLLRPSGNVDQMLKDHDRQIQEVFRRSRLDKSKARKAHVDGSHAVARPCDLGGGPLFPSSRGGPVFPPSRGAV